jgi:hypothetical protein
MEHSIDIFKTINGLYKSNTLVTSLEVSDPYDTQELETFCQENECYYTDDHDDILFCNKTNQPKFWIR